MTKTAMKALACHPAPRPAGRLRHRRPTGPRIDHTYTAKGQSSRARFLVLHYTVSDRPARSRP